MHVLSTRQGWWAAQAEAVLAAEGVPAYWAPLEENPAVLGLEVSEPHVPLAIELLSGQLGEDIERDALRAEAARGYVDAPWLLRPAVATGLGVALLQIVAYAIMGGEADHSVWFGHGAMSHDAVARGEWWRLFTAAVLHADIPHVLGNALFFVLLVWAAGERLGSGMALCTWLLTAVAGFVASLLLSDISSTVGASGGLFGLLGAAAGHAMRHLERRGALRFRRTVQTFGSAALLLAFTAFSHNANVYAHVGGFVAGLVVGVLSPPRPPPASAQAVAAALTGGILVLAWLRALLPILDK